MSTGWYIEIWASDGKSAKEHKTFTDFQSALIRIDQFKGQSSSDILRVLAPSGAAPEEIAQVKARGALLL